MLFFQWSLGSPKVPERFLHEFNANGKLSFLQYYWLSFLFPSRCDFWLFCFWKNLLWSLRWILFWLRLYLVKNFDIFSNLCLVFPWTHVWFFATRSQLKHIFSLSSKGLGNNYFPSCIGILTDQEFQKRPKRLPISFQFPQLSFRFFDQNVNGLLFNWGGLVV